MYDGLIETLRKQCADMDCGNCNTCVKRKAADAIEFFSNRLCDACGVCPADKRNPFNCEIAGTDER